MNVILNLFKIITKKILTIIPFAFCTFFLVFFCVTAVACIFFVYDGFTVAPQRGPLLLRLRLMRLNGRYISTAKQIRGDYVDCVAVRNAVVSCKGWVGASCCCSSSPRRSLCSAVST